MDRNRLSPLSRTEAVVADVLITTGVGAVGVWRELAQEPHPIRLIAAPVGVYVAVQVVAALLLLWRRHHPAVTGVACAALCLVSPAQAAVVAIYSCAAHDARRGRAVLVSAVIAAAFAIGGRLWLLDDPWTSALVLSVAFLLGLYVRARRGLLVSTAELARWTLARQQWAAEQAAAAERSRLAAEMHDVVSHRFSAVMIGAGSLLLTESDPPVRDAVERLREQAIGALAELRDVFGVLASQLTGSAPGQDPTPTSSGDSQAALGQLVQEWRALGMQVELEFSGADGATTATPAVSRTVHRVVEEGLTNAAKHAQGSPVAVRVEWAPVAVRVRVANGPGKGPSDEVVRRSGSGRGLMGLGERVAMLGGNTETSVTPAGGFLLTVTIPTSTSGSTSKGNS